MYQTSLSSFLAIFRKSLSTQVGWGPVQCHGSVDVSVPAGCTTSLVGLCPMSSVYVYSQNSFLCTNQELLACCKSTLTSRLLPLCHSSLCAGWVSWW
jgi:hypothetical protein